MTEGAALLQADGASKRYARTRADALPAVSSVSLAVRAGTVTGIVGESGSGKTTLARMMAGLLRPDSGSITFAGARIDHLRGAGLRGLRRRLQYVHQDPAAALDPRMRVRSLLHEPLLIHSALRGPEREARVRGILDAVGVPLDALDRFPHQVSGGQQRRIGLARILILEPSLVILDEPTAGLDLLVQAALLTLLDTLKRRLGLAYVIVTHDIAVVDAFCDDVAVMYRGRIVEYGSAGPILSAPSHPYTQALLSALPRIDGPRVIDKIGLEDESAAFAGAIEGCAFRPRCSVSIEACRNVPPLATRGDRRAACWASASAECL